MATDNETPDQRRPQLSMAQREQLTDQLRNGNTGMVEMITWHPLPGHVPSDGEEVLLCVQWLGDRMVSLAYLDEGDWRWDCGGTVSQELVAWAEAPVGPKG